MNPVDLLGAKIFIRVRIGMTHPYIKKSGPLSLPETPTVDIKACIRGLVSPSVKLFACDTSQADILVAAIGRSEYVTKEMVKPGAVVIDVGINRIDDASAPKGSRLVGDVAFEEVAEKAEAITPVPGGVGPMTIAMLMANTVNASRFQNGLEPMQI